MMEVKIIEINKNDTLIFKFHMELGKKKLTPISENFRDVTGCNVICIDEKCDLQAILKYQKEENNEIT